MHMLFGGTCFSSTASNITFDLDFMQKTSSLKRGQSDRVLDGDF